jgi:hypothetical protein
MGHRRRRGGLCAIAAAVVAALALAAVPVSAAGPLSWSQPRVVDHEQPLATRHLIQSVACPSDELCVALDADGGGVWSANPAAAVPDWSFRTAVGNATAGLSCPTTTFCLAIGVGGDFGVSRDGGRTWSAHPVPFTSTWLSSVSCPSSSLCVAVDQQGGAFKTDDPGAARPTWTAAPAIAGPNRLNAVSCPSTGLCVAVGAAGNVVVTTDPAAAVPTWRAPVAIPGASALTGVACPSQQLCVAIDDGGRVHRTTDPSAASPTWSSQTVSGSQLQSVSCTPTASCVVTAFGALLSTPDATAAAPTWSSVSVLPHFPIRSACARSTCVVGTTEGRAAVTTNPAASPAAWSAFRDVAGTNDANGVDCPTETLCVMTTDAGRIASTTQPTLADPAWRLTPVGGSWLDVACPSSQLCVASGAGGRIAVSTEAGAAAPTWSAFTVTAGDLSSIACPTTSFCVTVGAPGRMFAAQAPTARGSWYATTPIAGATAPAAVSCPSTALCAVADGNGKVLTTTDPTAAEPTWTAVVVSIVGMVDVACPATGLCVATDLLNDVYVSANPTAASPTWTKAGRAFGRLSCPSTAFCAAAAPGVVMTTTDPTTVLPWAARNPTGLDGGTAAEVACASPSLCVVDDDFGRAVIGVAPPTQVAPPSVSGSAAIGAQLSAGDGTWTAAPALTHRWLRCDAAGGACAAVAGAPASRSYIVTAADVGATLRVEEDAANAAGTGTARSAPTAVVPAPPPPDEPGGPSRPVPPTAAAVRASLRPVVTVRGRSATLRALLKRGRYETTFTARGAGRLVVTWTSVPKSKKAKAKLLARARVTVRRAGRVKVRLTFTKAFRQLARRAKQLKVAVKATFTPTGGKAVAVKKTVTLTR